MSKNAKRIEWAREHYSSPHNRIKPSDKIVIVVGKFGPLNATEISRLIGVGRSDMADRLRDLVKEGRLTRRREEIWPKRNQYVYRLPT